MYFNDFKKLLLNNVASLLIITGLFTAKNILMIMNVIPEIQLQYLINTSTVTLQVLHFFLNVKILVNGS